MKLSFDSAELAFRDEVRAFIAQHFTAERPFTPGTADEDRWAAALLAQGWAAYQWPAAHGGTGWSMTQKYIWERETALAGVPARMGGMGMFMLAPVLYTYGSAEQCHRFLPGILDNSVEWCQGYSEPEAGSDLAALRTRAVRDGDHYVVDGLKTWTSYAHIADWMFCIVRTDDRGRRQEGITFLLIDMRSPGVRVQPIVTLDGRHSTLNTVTFDGVRVPVDQRVGEEGQGWRYAKGLLTHERTGLAYVADSTRRLRRLRETAARTPAGGGGRLIDDPLFAARLAEVEIELMALEITELRTLAETAAGQAPGPQSSILKLQGTLVLQRLTELFIECGGLQALPYSFDERGLREEMSTYLIGRSASIAGGANEVQRDIIARHVLGLP